MVAGLQRIGELVSAKRGGGGVLAGLQRMGRALSAKGGEEGGRSVGYRQR